MSERLPPNHSMSQQDVFEMIIIRGLESVTRSLRRGDAHDLTNLRPLANRCRALADAFEARKAEIVTDD